MDRLSYFSTPRGLEKVSKINIWEESARWNMGRSDKKEKVQVNNKVFQALKIKIA